MTEPSEVRRTVYLNRLPLPVTIAISLIAVAALIASVGLLQAQRHSQDEVAYLNRQLSDEQTAQKCRASYDNDVALALADKVIAIGDTEGLIVDFLLALIKQDQVTIRGLSSALAANRQSLNTAGVALRRAIEEQRKALANC